LHVQVSDARVRGFTGGFEAVNHDPAGIGFESQQTPVKGGDLNASASGRLQGCDQPLADEVFKGLRAGAKIGADGRNHEQKDRACHRQRKMAEKEAVQTAAHSARGRLRRDGRRDFVFAQRPPLSAAAS
jgi:hypothetical protein